MRAAAKVKDKSWKSQPFSTRNRQAPLIDAATAPTLVVVDADEDVTCIKKEQPPVDAARLASECGERVLNSGDDVQSALPYDSDSELTDMDDIPETTLGKELLEEVGLSVTDEP